MTGLGLKEAKEFVEAAPILLKAADMTFNATMGHVAKTEEAAIILRGQGANVEVCYGTEQIPTVLDSLRVLLGEVLSERGQVSDESADD